MKNYYLSLILLVLALNALAQAPASFKYQAVVRYQDGAIVQNQTVALRISILLESPVGNTVYKETHNVATNEFGIANLNIGEGNTVEGNFNGIDWGSNTYFIQTELDLNNTSQFEFIGTSQLLSVPYALYAANAVNVNDDDADPSNEIQLLSFSNDTVYLENGGWVYLGDYTDNTDEQTLNLDGTTLTISNGNSVTFNEAVDMDGDPTNELQLLSISNDTIYLSQGNYVKLPEAFDWQYSSLIGVPTDVSYFNNDAGYLSEEYQALEDVLMINNDAGNRKIRNVDNPEYPKDVATKEYVDNIMNILDNNNLTVVDFIVSNSLFFYENEPVEFVDISLIEPISWQWDFGDGGTSILQNPNHIYETTGTYVVSLTASNEILSYTKQKEIYFHLFECGDTFEDEFSNTFETVLIGNQCWLKQNLNVDYDSQGNIVSKTCYNNDVQNCEIFGGLYSWNEIMNGSNSSSNSPSGVQGICPVGWHIPSKLEWEELISYLGGNGIAGGKMKETGFDYWESPNTGATNSSGFTALGGGGYNDGSFNNLKMKAFWWTTNENGNQARIFDVVNYNAGIGNYDVDKDRKLSVRCIKD